MASVMMLTHMAAAMADWPIWFWAMGDVALTIIVPAAFAKMNMMSMTQNTGVRWADRPDRSCRRPRPPSRRKTDTAAG